MTAIASYFASNYVFHWSSFFPSLKLEYPPTFDARVVLYPSKENIKDYLSWRQADCHINNLYNTCFWNLVKSGKTTTQAEQELKGTLSDYKNELLFSTFGINYNFEPPMFKKGSVIYKKDVEEVVKNTETGEDKIRTKKQFTVVHEDIISEDFWIKNPSILK